MKINGHVIYYTLLLFLFVAFANMVSAQESYGSVEIGTQISLTQTCINSTYANITRIIAPNKTFVINSQTAMVQNGYDYSHNFNITNAGYYYVYGQCDENGILTNWQYDVKGTPNGEEPTIAGAVFYIGLLAILIFFLAISIYSFMTFDSLLGRVATLGISYLLLIAVTFVGWQMASDFLTSSPFLISMLRILFLAFVICAFPLLIGSFAYYILAIFKIKEIERLMTKGMDMDEAERRVGRRK